MADALKISGASVLLGTAALMESELKILKNLLDAGDRGAFHYVYAKLAENRDALLTTKISTFSETVGGTAFAANWYLQNAYGPNGALSGESGLYSGIYILSQLVARTQLLAVQTSVGGGGSGKLTVNEHFLAAAEAWRSVGLVDQFPGNFIDAGIPFFLEIPNSNVTLLDLFNRFGSQNPGIEAVRFAALYAHYTGKRSEDFGPEYTRVKVPDGELVLDSAGRVTAAFISEPVNDTLAVASNLASRSVNAFWTPWSTVDDEAIAALTKVGDPSAAGSPTDAVYQAARRNFTEFASGYTGDSEPRQDFVAPIITIRPVATDGDEIIFSDSVSGIVDGRGGNDLILGKVTDPIFGLGGADTIRGGAGNDLIWGHTGLDELDGGAGDDVIRGGFGDDVLRPGAGSDIVDGGDISTVRSSDGVDTADYSTSEGEAYLTAIKILIEQGDQKDKGVITVVDGQSDTDLLFSIEKIIGSDVDDEVIFYSIETAQLDGMVSIDGGKGADALNFSSFTGRLDSTVVKRSNSDLAIQGVLLKNFETLIDNGQGARLYFPAPADGQPQQAPPNTQTDDGSGNDPTSPQTDDEQGGSGGDNPEPPPFGKDVGAAVDKVVNSDPQNAASFTEYLTRVSNALQVVLGNDYAPLGTIESVFGGDGDDFIAAGAGVFELRGEGGNDFLLGQDAVFVPKMEGTSDTPPQPEKRLTLDGGIGDDWVVALGGTGAVTVGGLGRDFLFNTSYKGQIYGDTIDGLGRSESGKTDADVFWYWPGTFIMDAAPNDLLQWYGLPLLGGTICRLTLCYSVSDTAISLVARSFRESPNQCMQPSGRACSHSSETEFSTSGQMHVLMHCGCGCKEAHRHNVHRLVGDCNYSQIRLRVQARRPLSYQKEKDDQLKPGSSLVGASRSTSHQKILRGNTPFQEYALGMYTNAKDKTRSGRLASKLRQCSGS